MTTVPQLTSPFPYQINPHVERATAHLNDWVRQARLIGRPSARKRFERARFAWFAGVVYPTADAPRLELMADWFAWLFLVDDQFDDGRIGRDPKLADVMLSDLRAVLRGNVPTDNGPADNGPADNGPKENGAVAKGAVAKGAAIPAAASLADLWRRTIPGTTTPWRRRFAAHLEECLRTAVTWEMANRIGGLLPEENEYIEKRRHTGAIYVCMDLIEVVEHLDIPRLLYFGPAFTAVLNAACNVVCWTNDVYSLEKERSLGEVHNLVYLVERHRRLSRDEALSRVCAAIDEETRRYLAREAELLASHPARDDLRRCTAGMRSWMRGNLDWSSRTQRYQAPGRPGPARAR